MTTLLLIPGLVSDARVWRDLAQSSPFPVADADVSRDSTIPEMAARLLAEHPGPLLPVGHSMGGRVAMEMARQAPDRVRGLILSNTGHDGRKPDEDPKRLAKIALGHADMPGLAAEWLPPMLDPARTGDSALIGDLTQMVLAAGPDVHERQIRALLDRPDAGTYLGDITVPVLLLTGAQDGWSPEKQHREIAAMLPGRGADAPEVQVIDGAGHFLPVERPAETRAAILGWLARHKTTLMEEEPVMQTATIPETPLFDREGSKRGYRMNKMAMSLGTPANREAFKADEEAFLDSYGLSEEEKSAVMSRDWHRMVALGGNLFFILKISAVDPTPMTQIGAAQAQMDHDLFLKQRLGKN